MNARRLCQRTALLLVLTCIARGAPHDFATGQGNSPGGPNDPNSQGPCHHGSANDPDASGDSDPVDLFRGELILDRRDVFVPGRGLSVDLTFHYRSQSKENGQFGYGWAFNYSRRLRRLDNGNAVLLQGTNYIQEFIAAAGGAFTSPGGNYSTLHQNGDGTFTLTYRDKSKEIYDINGCLARVEDPSGNEVTFSYDVAGLLPIVGPSNYFVGYTKAVVAREYRLTQITDTIGNTYDFEYNADGLLSEISYLGRTVSYAYSAQGDLASVTLPGTAQFPAGRTTTYTYVGHNLTEIRNAKGELTLTTVYNPTTDRVTSQTFDGGTATYAIATVGGTTKATVVDRKGFTTEYTFNAAGQVVQSKRFTDGVPAGEPASYITSYQYASTGELIRVVYPRGNAVELTRDAQGNVTQERRKKIGAAPWTPSADDLVETYTYESVYNQLKTATDPLGRTMTLTYDYELAEPSRGLLRKVTLPPPSVGPTPELEYVYDAYGQLLASEDPNGNVTRLDRDVATGYVERVTEGYGTPAATAVELDYDAFGNVSKARNGLGQETTIEYDAHDLMTKVISPAPFAFETHYRYDANSKVIQVDRQIGGGSLPGLGTSSPSDGWQTTRFAYSVSGRITTVIDDHLHTTSLAYDANGNLATLVDPLSGATTLTYDERDLPLTVVDPGSPAGTMEYRFDANANLVSIRSPAGHLTSHTYDDFDRLKRTTYADAAFEEYGYDKASNMTSLLTANGQPVTCVYDGLDRLTSIVRPTGTDAYMYDLGGRLTQASNAEAVVNFFYDAADRETHEITTFAGSSLSHAVQYRYDASSRLDRITYPDSSNVLLGYDTLGRLETVTGASLLAEYGYDPLGNLTTIERANGVDTTRVFDSLSRLVELDHDGPLGSLDSRVFDYDAVGRRKEEVGPEGTHQFEYDPLSQLVETLRPMGYPFASTTFTLDADGNRTAEGAVTYAPNALDQYASVGGIPLSYDSSGNLIDDGTLTYSYDAGNRLVGVTGPLLSATYGYDALGRRVRKTVNGTKTLYVHDSDQILQELSASEAVQATFVYGVDLDEPLTMKRAATTSWYLADPIGTVTALTDASGAVSETYRYDAFGETAIFDASSAPLSASAYGNPFLYTGRQVDTETGLYHYRARAYSPALGRFVQRDPLGQLPDVNVYRYAGNHPLDSTDPLGLDWLSTASNFSAGMGDTISFGLTSKVRDWMGTNHVVDKCSGAYGAGQAAGTAVSAAMGGAGALKAAGSQLGKMGLKEIAKKAPRFFYDPRNFKTISKEYWKARGGAGGKSLHHWFFGQKSKWVPEGIRNAGFNLLELPGMRGVFHRSLGLNQWMGFAARWGGRARLRALAVENTIRYGIPATVAGVPALAYVAANQDGKD